MLGKTLLNNLMSHDIVMKYCIYFNSISTGGYKNNISVTTDFRNTNHTKINLRSFTLGQAPLWVFFVEAKNYF